MPIKTDTFSPRVQTPQAQPAPDLPGSSRAQAPANVPRADAFQAQGAAAPRTFSLDGITAPAPAATGDAVLDQSLKSLSTMGAQKQPNGDVSFKYWAPDAKSVSVKVQGPDGDQLLPMTRDAQGYWTGNIQGGWEQVKGSPYAYQVQTSDGQTVSRPDPYARQMEGEQRGVGRVYVDNRTGAEVNPFFMQGDLANALVSRYGGDWSKVPWPEKQKTIAASRAEMMRFEVEGEPQADAATLTFKDENGHQLTKAELLQRVGAFDSSMPDALQTKLRGGQFDDLWSRNVNEDGSINLTKEGGAWNALVNGPDKLVGLKYEFQTWKTDPATGQKQLLHDQNADGQFSDAERKAAADNDPFDNTITADSGKSFRSSVISDGSFDWKNDAAPRETDKSKWVIEQAHVGSFLGTAQNTQRSTFEDMQNQLQYFKQLGVNTIELLPTNEVEGNRDWGYMGASSLATESSYGFEDKDGKWVSGTDALKRFIDEAHRQGLNVVNDVVYNHVGGDENSLWNLDGPQNPFFNWGDPNSPQIKNTDWGSMPAYNNPAVKQFFVDHAVSQASELHYDGLRFDFTQPIKADWGGGGAGWNMLRDINDALHAYNPNFFTTAEQFDYDPWITKNLKDGGAGFDAQWFTEFNHRLVHDNGRPSLLQQAAAGQRTDMDAFMNMLTNHVDGGGHSVESWGKAVTVITDHDEVGNAQRVINVADKDAPGVPSQYSRDLARFAAGIGMASPGIPMFFQGEENLASNKFNWGNPSTWDTGWSWKDLGQNWDWNNLRFDDQQRSVDQALLALPPAQRASDPRYQSLAAPDRQVVDDLGKLGPADQAQAMTDIARRQTFDFYKDAIALRESSPAFAADAAVNRVYTHNDNSVMAFTREKGNDSMLVVGSLNHGDFNGYRMDLPPGKWQEVFNSDASRYGGGNFGNFGATLNGGSQVPVNIPAGGYVVFKKVG